jgi:hypothetical protein
MSGQQPLEALEKEKLCQLKETNPKLSHKYLIAKAKEKFTKTPSDSQIARILKRKGAYLILKDDNDDNRERLRAAKWPAIDEATDIWFDRVCFRLPEIQQ